MSNSQSTAKTFGVLLTLPQARATWPQEGKWCAHGWPVEFILTQNNRNCMVTSSHMWQIGLYWFEKTSTSKKTGQVALSVCHPSFFRRVKGILRKSRGTQGLSRPTSINCKSYVIYFSATRPKSEAQAVFPSHEMACMRSGQSFPSNLALWRGRGAQKS